MTAAAKEDNGTSQSKERAAKKIIKGNLPYTPAPGVFKKTLENIITAGQPERFTSNFMDTVLNVSGGSSRYVPPLLKKMSFLTSDGVPTDLYTSFRQESSRSSAAYAALKNAFGELFQRNEFIHRASEPDVRDYIIGITGLPKNDVYVNYIWSTFKAVRDFVTGDPATHKDEEVTVPEQAAALPSSAGHTPRIGLVNNINIVLPESNNINVYNLIFQSLRSNLLS